MPIRSLRQFSIAIFSLLLLSACENTPPDHRNAVTLPVYTQGDAVRGAILYKDACAQCHQLNAGLNKKGPQLMNIYGAPAAALADYTYSEALEASGWVWDAQTLDPYIADVEQAMPESKMLADPMPDATERADLIAYLSTLRNPAPASQNNIVDEVETDNSMTKMQNEAVAIPAGDENKPSARF